MDQMFWEGLIGGIAMGGVLVLGGVAIGAGITESRVEKFRKQAVKFGFAHYVLGKDGQTKWKWNVPEAKP